MITRIMSSMAPKAVTRLAKPTADKGARLKKFMQSEGLGKVLDVAAENPPLCQSLFALAICLGPRPLTNYLVTEDKKDATYASCHSISSGIVGFLWPMLFVTPIATGVKRMAANPLKYFKPEVIKKFYPNVGIKEELANDGKTIIKKILTNEKGQMLRKDGSVLCADLEPLMVYGKENQAKFAAEHPELLVDKSGVVRSRSVFKTEGGVYKLDKNGNKIGVAVQKQDFNPITEEMEIGAKKEQNVQKFMNMVPDIILSPFRATLTIALIPPLLDAFGIKKSNHGAPAQGTGTPSFKGTFIPQGDHVASTFNAFKKGGV